MRRALLSVREEIRPGDVVRASDLSATQPGEVFFSHVSARAIEAVCLLMIDSLDLETLIYAILRCHFIGARGRTLRDRANE